MKTKTFVDAAKLIDMEEFCCFALSRATHYKLNVEEIRFFSDTFEATKRKDIYMHDACYGWWGRPEDPTNQTARVIALLLCAELVKDEQKK